MRRGWVGIRVVYSIREGYSRREIIRIVSCYYPMTATEQISDERRCWTQDLKMNYFTSKEEDDT